MKNAAPVKALTPLPGSTVQKARDTSAANEMVIERTVRPAPAARLAEDQQARAAELLARSQAVLVPAHIATHNTVVAVVRELPAGVSCCIRRFPRCSLKKDLCKNS